MTRDVYASVREHLQVAVSWRKRYYDIRVKDCDFQPGIVGLVLLPIPTFMEVPQVAKAYIGPYLIVSVLTPLNAVLQKSKKSSPFIVHFDKLKAFYGTPPTGWRSTTTSTIDMPSRRRDPGDVTAAGHPSSLEIQLTNDVQSVPAPVEDQPVASDMQLPTPRLKRHRRPPKHLDAYCFH